MRDRDFYINSIKMDLYRVVTAVGDIRKPPAVESAKQFLAHAIESFKGFNNTQHDMSIRDILENHVIKINELDNPTSRLIWAENILTARCRMY